MRTTPQISGMKMDAVATLLLNSVRKATSAMLTVTNSQWGSTVIEVILSPSKSDKPLDLTPAAMAYPPPSRNMVLHEKFNCITCHVINAGGRLPGSIRHGFLLGNTNSKQAMNIADVPSVMKLKQRQPVNSQSFSPTHVRIGCSIRV